MRKSLAALVLSFAFAQPSLGGDQGSVVGTWKLVSYEVEAQASGERGPVMGQSPTGYAAFLPEGRVFFMLTGEARKPGKTDRERADLLSTLVAYTGTYRLDGDKWTTRRRGGLEPGVGRHRAGPFLQARRRAPASPDAVARDAELGRQGHEPEHRHVRAIEIAPSGRREVIE